MQKQRRKELLVSLMYRKHRKNPPPPTRKRTRNDHKSNFKLTKPKLTLRKKSPGYRGKKLWNKLPHHVQLSETKELSLTQRHSIQGLVSSSVPKLNHHLATGRWYGMS